MSFDSVEQSIQSSQPVELYDIVAPTQTWRITTNDIDIVFNGNTYTATTGARSNLANYAVGDNTSDMVLSLPANHAISQMYVPVAPRDLQVTLTRYHPASGVSLQFFTGYASGASYAKSRDGGAVANFQCVDALTVAVSCDVPGVVASRVCNHVLGDSQCTVVLSSFTVATTITNISADGTIITFASSVPAAVNGVDWSLHGALKHTSSGESRTIISQVALNEVTLQAPMPSGVMHVGDAIAVIAGCAKSLDQCSAKFANAINNGSLPLLPQSNVFIVGMVAAQYHQYNPGG